MLSSVECRDRSYRVVRKVQAPTESPFKELDSNINELQTQAWRITVNLLPLSFLKLLECNCLI